MAELAASAAKVIPLRPYQEDAIRRVRTEMASPPRGRGHRRVALVLPTGSGKTRTAAAIVAGALAKGTRVLWLAHRAELVEQACRTLEGFGIRCGAVAAASSRRPDPDAPCQVASIQTLLARETHRPPAQLLVWDEVHHCSEAAACWSGLLDAYNGVPIVGLTATPERGDGAGLAPLFDGLVAGATVRQLTADGHLVPCEVIRPRHLLQPGQIAQGPLEAYRAHGLDSAGRGRPAILFARTVEEATTYAAAFTAGGFRAEAITALTPQGVRDQALEAFRRGLVRVLCNVYVLTEGTDLPSAEVCVLARGAGTAGIFLQMVGRVLRPAPGKASALLLDLRGITYVHGMPEDERIYSLEGRGISRAQEAHCIVCSALLEGGYPCGACGYAPTQAETAETVVTGEPLVKFARKIAEGPVQRWETLLRWVDQCVARGWKLGSVRHKWRAVYSEDLPFETLMKAAQEVRNGH